MKTVQKILFATLFAVLMILPFVSAAPPAGFQTTQVLNYGLNNPVSFEFAPDGRLFILERNGPIKIYKNGQLNQQVFADVKSTGSGDRGLIGVAFDPDFNTNHWVYFYYTGADLYNYLVRYDASTDVGQNPVVIYRTYDQSYELHVGGSIHFGPDGKLWFAIGDNGYPPNSQSLGNPHGKIFRINKDGSIPQDNPFVGQAGALPEIWAYGFRNPWRFTYDSYTNNWYVGDVGDGTWEEIDKLQKGANYGWPICEGYCNQFTQPMYTWNHDGGSSAVTLGHVYRGTMFPNNYQGRLFFADYAKGWIKTMQLDPQGNNAGVFDFDPAAGPVVDFKVMPDGSLWYMTIYPGVIYKITYANGNRVPIAQSSANPTKGAAPLNVQFSSQGSYDPDGTALTYDWDFGDGAHSALANPAHTYNKGTFTAQLVVSDGQSQARATPITIQSGTPPSVTISSPQNNSKYKAGDTIYWSASATDGNGAAIPDSGISTSIIFHHLTHIHPFLGPVAGKTGSFTVPNSGEPSPITWFEIMVTATDANGISTTKSNFVYPILSNITIDSNPTGLQLYLDGVPFNSPQTIKSIVNFQRELSVLFTQYRGNTTYQFDSWSDGGAQTHIITTPQTDTTYTANYKIFTGGFKGEYFNNQNLTGSPLITRSDPTVDFDWGTYSPDALINGDHFSARWTKTQAFANGTYKFTITADDGFRVKIDNILLIDKWIDQPATTYTINAPLAAENHTIVMEYYENTGNAVAKISWASSDTFSSMFHLSNPSQWWEEVNVVPGDTRTISKVQIRFNSGNWIDMTKKSWGNWATNINSPAGTKVEFLAFDPNGATSQSLPFTWLDGTTSKGSTVGQLMANFYLSPNVNNYWVEVDVKTGSTLKGVEVKVDGGAWTALDLKTWGNWAKSIYVASGTSVQFRATDTNGNQVLSDPFTWP